MPIRPCRKTPWRLGKQTLAFASALPPISELQNTSMRKLWRTHSISIASFVTWTPSSTVYSVRILPAKSRLRDLATRLEARQELARRERPRFHKVSRQKKGRPGFHRGAFSLIKFPLTPKLAAEAERFKSVSS